MNLLLHTIMGLAENIKQYRNDHHIKQEYVADKINVHQTTYHRIENNNERCAKRLPEIANALETTPDVLKNYHITNCPKPELPETVETLLAEKETLIENLHIENTFLKHYTTYLHSVWNEYCLGYNREQPVLNK
ncbi:helix-turn-helix transcriptional regulator [Spirosoma aureum]|uniref:Helix-turn-helix transcriptional regulator n=1 Tax=Spirosoma aureum TaxID=2692134 RepID=A0A6G9AW73_9BACT|nr:helix-turn-helix transcriptional regulator [Spirosoma aureum]QIP16722.1 helix-turn-helix transcriptional regulator [Spirosoma aureum]